MIFSGRDDRVGDGSDRVGIFRLHPVSGFAEDRIPLKMTVFVVAELGQIEPLPTRPLNWPPWPSYRKMEKQIPRVLPGSR